MKKINHILKGFTTITLAIGATILALSLFANDSVVIEKASSHPTEPSVPSGSFSQQGEGVKPSAPSKPVFAEVSANPKGNEAKDNEESGKVSVAPTEPIPVPPAVVSMGINPNAQAEKKQEKKEEKVTIHHTQSHAPAKPNAPKPIERPAEMKAPQLTSTDSSATNTGDHATSINMPTMNMSMPQMKMPTMNMKMPTTSVRTNVSSPTTSNPANTTQPVTSGH